MLVASILVVFPFCMAFAAVSDLLSMTIANRVALLLVGTFTVLAPMTGMQWSVYGMHFAAFALVLSVTFAMFALGGMGGGDAKLMAATALWMGFGPVLFTYLLISAGIGGLLTLAILSYRGSALEVYTGSNVFFKNLADPSKGIPYGIALGTGGLFAFAETPLAMWALCQLSGF